ncbi:MAG: efflux RND transporter periplasmic adaptor subunit [bacterium]|nr:efflux RND transporter periplasmic adaptor subunit [bacterium]
MKKIHLRYKPYLRLLKKKRVVVPVLVFVVAASAFLVFSGGKGSVPYEYVEVQLSELVQEVSVTGRVKAAEYVDLAFERGGRVAAVYAQVGDAVPKGALLVNLANGDIAAQLAQAKASLKAEQAKLSELQQGSRPEEIRVQEVKAESAELALEDAQQVLLNAVNGAYTTSDDAVRNKADQLFLGGTSLSPQLRSELIIDFSIENVLRQKRLLLETFLSSWKTSLEGLSLTGDLLSFASEAKTNLNEVRAFLELAGQGLNNAVIHSGLSQTTLDSWKADVSLARTSVNTAITTLSSSEAGLQNAKSALALAAQELALKRAGSSAEQIQAQEAQVERARAQVDQYEAELRKTIITAPISGVVTRQDAKVGEIAGANTTVASLISENRFEIEANVPEADIANLKIGDTASFTLDAFGPDRTFQADVSSIDPAETVIEGVPTYKIKLQFVREGGDVKSGMTADVTILTARKDSVISVPGRAVFTENGEKLVRIVTDTGELEQRKVETGLRGSDGRVEITSGVSEGEKVVVFLRS